MPELAVTPPAPARPFPRFRPVADRALLVEFGDTIDAETHRRVRHLDMALAAKPFAGFAEAVPAYASVLVAFDPLRIDHAGTQAAVAALLEEDRAVPESRAVREVLVCYDREFAPDLAGVAERTGLSEEEVIAAHLAGDYRVFMYGFAPGYAYLGGVESAIRLARKQSAVRDVPAGSVIIAGPQCLVTTLTMPTGWWVIGRSPTRILGDSPQQFLFEVGDAVRFRRIDRDTYRSERRAAGS